MDLYEHQKQVFRIFDQMTSGTLCIKAPRQTGKTLLLENLLLRQSVNYKNTTSILIEPSWSQAKRVMTQIIKACKGTPLVDTSSFQDMIINFYNGSEVIFLSGSQDVDNIRGNTVSKNGVLIFDEAAFLKDDVVYKCLPFCNSNNARKIAVSTPLFKEGYFWETYKNSLEKLKNYNLVDFNNYDLSMLLSEEQKEEYKITMPYLIYLTEIAGEFIDAYSTLFGDINSIIDNSYKGQKTNILGIDWSSGTGSDYTAISGYNNLKNMTYFEAFNDISPTEQIEKITNIIGTLSPDSVIVEANSIGEIYYDMLKKSLINKHIVTSLKKFETTNESKRRIIENFISLVQQKQTTILDNPILKLQMSAYEIEATKTGKITYNGANNTHDDGVISSAIALDGLGKTNTYIFGNAR